MAALALAFALAQARGNCTLQWPCGSGTSPGPGPGPCIGIGLGCGGRVRAVGLMVWGKGGLIHESGGLKINLQYKHYQMLSLVWSLQQ